ncbi:MAG: hypothetical protein WDO16_15555 [Bacteroidota bacterium]
MKLISINRITLAVLVLFATVLYSCKKESSTTGPAETVTEDDAVTYSEESTRAEASFDDIEDISG